jgi:hypothetical protein
VSKRTESMDVYTCDACGKRFTVEEGGMPSGYHGQACEIRGDGGSADVPWFACKAAHIGKAVQAAVDRAWDDL